MFVVIVTTKGGRTGADVFGMTTCGARMQLMQFMSCGGETTTIRLSRETQRVMFAEMFTKRKTG